MKPSELKWNVEQTGSVFFNRQIMKFFGDTMANYGCYSDTINNIDVWCLYRKKPVKQQLHKNTYFSKDNFKRVYTED